MPDSGYRAPFQGGTKRAVAPEVTLQRIAPLLHPCGITRLADITGLDCLGIPVYTAMRPRGRITQSSQGKGVRAVDAKVSALMEAIEGFCAENPRAPFERASLLGLQRAGRNPIDPSTLYRFDPSARWTPSRKTLWVDAVDLLTGDPCLLPASSVYFIEPAIFHTSTNGLASGNDETEATLHALLEVYERDALSTLADGSDISFEDCDVIDPTSIDAPVLQMHLEKLERAGVTCKLLRVALDSAVHTFVALLLDPSPLASSSQISGGFGSHLSPAIAASRAITEAAQTRGANIHASREFLTMEMFSEFHEQFYAMAMAFEPDTAWSDLGDASTPTIAGDLRVVIQQCRDEGASHIVRHVLTPPGPHVAVVHVQIPGARDDFPM